MKDTIEFIKDDSNKIFIFINDNHLMIISVQTVVIISYVLSAYIKECIKKHNSRSKIENIVNSKDIDKHNEAKQNISSSKKTTSTSISYVKKDSLSPDKSSFIEERENSFTMRLRVEKEKERVFRKINKKEFKQKKKFSALSDFDDYEEVSETWKVVKGGKLCELKA